MAAPGSVIDVPWGFLDDAKTRASVVGFIGHSVDWTETSPARTFSVGVEFADRDLIKRRPPELGEFQWVNLNRSQNPDPQARIAEANAYAFRVDTIRTQAKFVFIASCFLGPEFLSLWDIDSSTPDRVLIVPANPNVTADLYIAAKYAWPALAIALSQGKTLGEAITAANNACTATPQPDSPYCGANQITWTRIGGSDDMRLFMPR